MKITEEEIAELEKKRMKFYEDFNHDEDAV